LILIGYLDLEPIDTDPFDFLTPWIPLILRSFTAFLCLAFVSGVNAELKGDPEAVELAQRMIESIGGRTLWSKIRSLHVVGKARSLKGDGILAESWHDLRQPREWYTLNNRRDMVVRTWWDRQGIWQTVNGKQNYRLPAGLYEEKQSHWPGGIYVMYHRLAREDETLRLTMNEDGSFTARDERLDRRMGRFWINADGELYRWRHDDGTEYIYGPHRSFGDISFPDWGSKVDGSWSFYYIEVRWSRDEPPISYDPQ